MNAVHYALKQHINI